jgi:hypothetical protein
MSAAIDNLPPEMKARLAQIMAQAQAGIPEQPHQPVQQQQVPQQQPPAPQAKAPSLMDHIVALRKEVSDMRVQVDAVGQVTEAVGNAVGQMYQMFQVQTQPTNYGANLQAQGDEVAEGDY